MVAVAVAPNPATASLTDERTNSANFCKREGYSVSVTLLWLVGSLSVLLLASVLTIGPERRVYLPGIILPLPESCAMYSQFGLDCPGCGLTRSFIHFADGNLSAGIRLNPAGIVIFLYVVSQIPASILRLYTGAHSRSSIAWARLNEMALIALPCLTLVQWFVRLAVFG